MNTDIDARHMFRRNTAVMGLNIHRNIFKYAQAQSSVASATKVCHVIKPLKASEMSGNKICEDMNQHLNL